MLIQMLKLGNTQTNIGFVKDKQELIGLGDTGGDYEYGRYTINYNESQLYKAKDIIGLEFEEIDVLQHRELLKSLKGKSFLDMELNRTQDLYEYLSTYTNELNSDFYKDLDEIDFLGNVLFGYLTGTHICLRYDINVYNKDEDDCESVSVGDISVSYHGVSIDISLDLCLNDIFQDNYEEDNIVITLNLESDVIEELLKDDNRNMKVIEMLSSKLKEVTDKWVLKVR